MFSKNMNWRSPELSEVFCCLDDPEVKTIRLLFFITTGIIVDLMFSGVFRSAESRHESRFINSIYFDTTC